MVGHTAVCTSYGFVEGFFGLAYVTVDDLSVRSVGKGLGERAMYGVRHHQSSSSYAFGYCTHV
jgi:hypothetical protein